MLFCRFQACSLAIIALLITRIVAIGLETVGSKVESSPRSLISDIGAGIDGIIGDIKGDFGKLEQDVESEIAKALVNSDGVLGQFTMAYQTKPPISAQLLTSGLESNVTIGLYCADCKNSSQPKAFDFASQKYNGYNSSWLGFALTSFDAMFELNVDLSAEANGDLTLSLLKLILPPTDGVVVEVDFQIYLVADASASMSFTAGLNLSLTDPAAIMMPALDPIVNLNQSERIGFDQDSFVLTPIFNASMPQLDFSMQISLRTVFSVTAEDLNIGALYLDLPAYNLTINTLSNATSNCQTPQPGTPSDEIYAELIHLDGALVAELSYEILDGGLSGVIEDWTIGDKMDKCYAFFPGLGSIGVVPDSSQSPLLTAPPITTCTTGAQTTSTGVAAIGAAINSLNAGAKAGAVIGTLIGVAIIATMAWFIGRASLRHSIKNDGTTFASTILRPPPYRFFSRDNRPEATKFSPLPPGTSAWQTSAYGDEFVPGSEVEKQQQFEQQGWQMAEKAPVVAMREAKSPAPTYVSIGDEYGTTIHRAGETHARRNDFELQPTMYGSYRTGQPEVVGLLYGEPRPVVPRKDLPRKPVPGRGSGSRGM